ncbi:MAG: leucyl aminopeptidase [Candidatus Gracilibacteria bacterium]|jgi:leucyl aminopeptidase|nr:leucyl aminopeptidase [Candidatus Gracilibacteria bacterium]
MKIYIEKEIKNSEGVLVIPIFEDETIKKKTFSTKLDAFYEKNLPTELKKNIIEAVKNKEFEPKFGEMLFTYHKSKKFPDKIILLGAGNIEKFTTHQKRRLIGKLAKFLKKKSFKTISILAPEIMQKDIPNMLEAFLMSIYDFTKHKSKNEEYEVKSITFISENIPKNIKQALKRAEILADANAFTKDLINSPSNIINSLSFSAEAKKIAKENDLSSVILTEKELKKMGWGGLLAVNQGSSKPPRVVVLKYDGASSKEKPIVLIGKGIIFDAGGYNIKPTNYIETMHQDMSGAAIVLGVMKVLKKLGIKKNVVGIMPLAENMVSAEAYKPSDIIKMFNGKTVEIVNTDAEGRLILADAITYATKLKPSKIITIATLTGAVAIALGNRYSGIISNTKEIVEALIKAGEEVGELFWQLPLHEDYRKAVESSIADYKNCDTKDREAGTAKAGAFLEIFFEDYPWAHIDIGSTAYTDSPEDFQAKGATGNGLRALVKFLEE